MTLGLPKRSGSTVGLALLGVATVVAIGVGDGNVAVALAPMLLVGLAWATHRFPLRHSALALLVLIFCVDSPIEVPAAGMWESPLMPLARVIFENLHKLTGIQALRVSGLDVLVIYLLGISVLRRLRGTHVDPDIEETPHCLKVALVVSFGTVVFLELMGLARGGDFQQSLWQMRELLFLPLVAALFQFGMRGTKDHRALAVVVVGSACFKVCLGSYFLFVIARAKGVQPPYVTTHSDSLLFVTAIVIAVALWMERPSRRNTLLCLTVIPFVLFGIIINDRRLAYVSLGACLLTIFLVSPRNLGKRKLSRLAVMMLPLLVPYLLVGWSSSSPVFKPVKVLRSVVASDAASDDQAESSTEFRNMENYNLMRTWEPNPLLGSGFGHEYHEVLLLPDISKYFPAYRFVPHNSILWLWGIGGYLGFSAMWMFLVLGVFLSARAYRAATVPSERSAALVFICVVVSFLNQAFGDMGTQGWTSVFLLGPAVVMGGKLAVSVGAWPAQALRRARMSPAVRALAPTPGAAA